MKREHDFTALKKHFDVKIPKGWNWKYLHELGSFSKGKGITKEQLSSTGIPCIRYGEIYTTHNFVVKEFTSYIPKEVAAESQKIKSGDILFAGSGETIEDIGKAVAYIGKEVAYAGGDVVILSTNSSVDPVYISYALNSSIANRQKRRLGQGQQVVHIYPNDLEQIKILVPPISVQHSIVKSLLKWGVRSRQLKNLFNKRKNICSGWKDNLSQEKNGLKNLKNLNGMKSILEILRRR